MLISCNEVVRLFSKLKYIVLHKIVYLEDIFTSFRLKDLIFYFKFLIILLFCILHSILHSTYEEI